MHRRHPRPPLFPYTTLSDSRECLGGLVTAGIVDHDAGTGTYALPPAHAACLSGAGSANLAPLSRITGLLGRHVGAVRSEEHTSELQSRQYLVCRLLLVKKAT